MFSHLFSVIITYLYLSKSIAYDGFASKNVTINIKEFHFITYYLFQFDNRNFKFYDLGFIFSFVV